MPNRQRMLIVFSNAYVFEAYILAAVKELAKRFQVSVLLSNAYVPESLQHEMQALLGAGIIEDFEVIPAWRHANAAAGYMTRSWFREATFWLRKTRELRRRNFCAVISHTGSRTFDWVPLGIVSKGGGICVCMFPVPMPATGESSPHANAFSRVTQSIRQRGPVTTLRKIADIATEAICIKGLSWNVRVRGTASMPTVGSFPFDAYMVASPAEKDWLRSHGARAPIQITHFPLERGKRRPDDCGDYLLLLLDHPPTNAPAPVEEIANMVLSLGSEEGLVHIHLRPHPRDKSDYSVRLREHLNGSGVQACIETRHHKLVESIQGAGAVAGSSSSSVDFALQYLHDHNLTTPLFRISESSREESLETTRFVHPKNTVSQLWPAPIRGDQFLDDPRPKDIVASVIALVASN